MNHLRLVLALVLVLLSLVAGPAAADWIVTTDGERIETHGPWKVEGRLVVMTLAHGELASMRLSQIDLEASRRVTEEAVRVAEAPRAEEEASTPARQRPTIVLTDDDFTTVRRAPVATPEDESGASEGTSPANAPVLTVLTSQESEDPETGGTVVSGVLANRSQNALANVSLTIRLYDVEDEVLGEAEAALSSPSLSPRGRVSFRALFPNVLAFARVEFDPRSVEILTQAPEGSAGSESPSGEGGDQGR